MNRFDRRKAGERSRKACSNSISLVTLESAVDEIVQMEASEAQCRRS